ncbi:hypothetical protein GCM10023085_03390 [Actinomadura viridis]|uniref:Uncharacterized protein n=1 Tax=Actinomadura viridis TaxID=58110 RepID=A0A931DP21_9ACTN|nr:hypothetical protein [Actinomadura viridis]MBG6091156.1 hypothetical protein [Actinomadura viridis]
MTELFRGTPELAPKVLNDLFGVPVPDNATARLECGDLTEWAPTEYRADVAVVLEAPDPALAVIVEVQRSRDADKRRSWPVYLTTLHARLKCPTVLLVVCPDRGTARWSTKPIRIGHPRWDLHPLVLGPDQIPAITDVQQATRDPEMAVLSAIAHGNGPGGEQVLEAVLHVLTSIDPAYRNRYYDLVFVALSEAARTYLEGLMSAGTYEYKSEFARGYFSEGKLEGEANALLRVLKARGIEVEDETAERIRNCTDAAQLETWIERAVTADSVHELFD